LRGARSAEGVWSSRPIVTFEPSAKLAKPVVTTRSDGARPVPITASVSFCWITVIALAVTVSSSLIT